MGKIIKGSGLFKKTISPYLYLLPFLAFYFILQLFPLVQNFYVSFTEWDMMSPEKPFVGLFNYKTLFFKDYLFWGSVWATLHYIFLNVPLKIVIGLGLALLLNQNLKGKTFHRVAIFIPFVLNTAVVGLLFRWILDPQFGMFNYYLEKVGLGPQKWLIEPKWTMEIVVLVTIWWSIAFNAIIYLAGLQGIPEELYDAGKIDGCNAWQRFLHITLPGLKNTTMFVVIMQVIGSFQAFGNIYMLTGGGPLNATRVLMLHLYEVGFYYFRMGQAAAISVIIFIIVLVLTIIMLKFFREETE
ncbi:MAG: sugar ABC transporter permease [Spirochaetes bacterium]|nr:sugar ABC transporter permease [Spirochaetota bacterium]